MPLFKTGSTIVVAIILTIASMVTSMIGGVVAMLFRMDITDCLMTTFCPLHKHSWEHWALPSSMPLFS